MAELSRRDVLRVGAVAAVALPFLGQPSMAWAAPAAAALPLTREAFLPYVGRTVRLTAPSGSVRLVLDRVEDIPGAAAGSSSQFSAMFRGSRGLTLPAGTYPLRLGGQAVELFVVPVDRGRKATWLQAIINRP